MPWESWCGRSHLHNFCFTPRAVWFFTNEQIKIKEVWRYKFCQPHFSVHRLASTALKIPWFAKVVTLWDNDSQSKLATVSVTGPTLWFFGLRLSMVSFDFGLNWVPWDGYLSTWCFEHLLTALRHFSARTVMEWGAHGFVCGWFHVGLNLTNAHHTSLGIWEGMTCNAVAEVGPESSLLDGYAYTEVEWKLLKSKSLDNAANSLRSFPEL